MEHPKEGASPSRSTALRGKPAGQGLQPQNKPRNKPHKESAPPAKTLPHAAPVEAYLANVANPQRRADAQRLLEVMSSVTGEPPVMWGPSIIGFGRYAYTYDSGRSGVSFATGFSPRASSLVAYFPCGFEALADQLSRVGPHQVGKACLYLKSLAALDEAVLREMIAAAVAAIHARYPDEGAQS